MPEIFRESFDDDSDAVDAVYEAGSTLAIQYQIWPIFSDGFESGNTSVWSSATPLDLAYIRPRLTCARA